MPLLGEPWRLYQGEALVRIAGLLVQAVWFYRSSHDDKFRPAYSINVLPEPDDSLHATLGSHLKNERGGDLWVPWTPSVIEKADGLMGAIREQAQPHIDEPLTLRAADSYLAALRERSHHFTLWWSLGIVRGVQEDLQQSREYLAAAEAELQQRFREFSARGQAPAWIIQRLERLGQLQQQACTPAAFVSYCNQEGARIKEALALPM